MRNKKFASIILALAICLAGFAGLAEDRLLFEPKSYEDLEEGEESFYLERMASDGEALYVLTNGSEVQRISRVVIGEEEPVLLYEKETGYSYIMGDEELESLSEAKRERANQVVHYLVGGKGQVYALNWYTKKLGTIDDSGLTWSDTVLEGLPSLTVQEADYSYTREVHFLTHADGQLTLGYRGDDWNSCEIAVIDIASGELTAEYTIENAEQIMPYKDGLYIGMRSRDAEQGIDLYAVNPAGGKEELLVEGASVSYYAPSGVCYDEATDAIYYSADSQIFRVLPGGKPEVVAYAANGNRSYGMPGIVVGDTYALASYQGLYLCSITEGVGDKRPIRLASGWAPTAVEKYTKENPQTPVLTINRYYSTSEELSTAIMSGEDALDIFSMSGQYGGFQTLKNKGYMESLSGSAAIVEAVDRMYPAIASMLKNDAGEVVALPYEIYTTGWSVNITLWEKEFPGQELPRTWDEWLTLLEDWEDTHSAEEEYGFYRSYDAKQELFYQAYQQFIMLAERDGRPVDFSDPELRAVLERIEALPMERPDWESMTQEENDELNEFANSPRIFATDNMGTFQDPDAPVMVWNDEEEQRYITYPAPVFTADQEPLIPVQVEVYFINPNSTNQEASMQLMEYLLANMDTYLRYTLYPDLNDPVPNENYDAILRMLNKNLKEYQDDLAEASPEEKRGLEDAVKNQENYIKYYEETGHWELTEGAIRAFREGVGPYLYTNENSLFMSYDGENSPQNILNEIISRYIDGQITLDDMLKEMTQKARMIEQESR